MGTTQIIRMASAAGAIEILMSRSAEAVYDIEGSSGVAVLCAPGGPIEGSDTKRLPEGRNRNPSHVDGRFTADFPSDHGHVLTDARKFVGNLPRHIFDSTQIRGESLDDDRDAQWESSRCRAG
jgi:hypothetical protein